MNLSKKSLRFVISGAIVAVLGLASLIAGMVIQNNLKFKLELAIEHNITNLDTILIIVGAIVMLLGGALITFAFLSTSSKDRTKKDRTKKDRTKKETENTTANYIKKQLSYSGAPIFIIGVIAYFCFLVMSYNRIYNTPLIETLKWASLAVFVIGTLLLLGIVIIDQMEIYDCSIIKKINSYSRRRDK